MLSARMLCAFLQEALQVLLETKNIFPERFFQKELSVTVNLFSLF